MGSQHREDAIIQNLRDAGCGEDMIAVFMGDLHAGKMTEGLKQLSAHRRTLLAHLHKEQKQIDCLDYLVYQLEKQV